MQRAISRVFTRFQRPWRLCGCPARSRTRGGTRDGWGREGGLRGHAWTLKFRTPAPPHPPHPCSLVRRRPRGAARGWPISCAPVVVCGRSAHRNGLWPRA